MAMPLDFVLVRHGESEGNIAIRKSRMGDHSAYNGPFRDRPPSQWRLTKKGKGQAKQAGLWIRENIEAQFDRFFTSSYVRAMETAVLLGFPNVTWYIEPYLRERDWGEMGTISAIERTQKFARDMQRQQGDSFYWAPPGGESLAQVSLRLDRVVSTLHRECAHRRVLMVCHGEVMWSFRARLERMSPIRFEALERSDNPHDHIHNCQVLHYTRINPFTNEEAPYLSWLRLVCPSDLRLSRNAWEKIERVQYTNEALLKMVSQFPVLIDD